MNTFVAVLWTDSVFVVDLMITLGFPHMERVCISDDGFGSFVKTENFYILPPACFCHFYMFVMNKLFYS